MIFQGYFQPQDPTNLPLSPRFLHPLFMGLTKLKSLNSIRYKLPSLGAKGH